MHAMTELESKHYTIAISYQKYSFLQTGNIQVVFMYLYIQSCQCLFIPSYQAEYLKFVNMHDIHRCICYIHAYACIHVYHIIIYDYDADKVNYFN